MDHVRGLSLGYIVDGTDVCPSEVQCSLLAWKRSARSHWVLIHTLTVPVTDYRCSFHAIRQSDFLTGISVRKCRDIAYIFWHVAYRLWSAVLTTSSYRTLMRRMIRVSCGLTALCQGWRVSDTILVFRGILCVTATDGH